MKKKKSLRVVLLLVISCILSAIITISAIEMLLSSYVKITTTNNTYSTLISYSERTKLAYEDSELFSTVFRDSITEVTRMCVIRDQMETGGKYDSSKKIDIGAYANRSSIIDYQGNKAEYKLDDLIKWGRHGFDFEVITGSKAEIDTYFATLASGEARPGADESRIIHIDTLDRRESLSDALVNSNPDVEDWMADEGEEESEDGYYTMYVLLDNYKSSEGRGLASYAENRKEYGEMVRNLCVSATDLFYNYGEYSEYNKRFEQGASNLIYCYQTSDGNGNIRKHSNISSDIAKMTNEDISKLFTSYSEYVCFNPDKLQIASTVDRIDAVFMKECLENYNYTFGDGSRIWIAVDTAYPVNDEFKIAKDVYTEKNNSFLPAMIVFFLSVIMLVVLFVLMTAWTGVEYVTERNGADIIERKKIYTCCKLDGIPFELYLLICGFTAYVLGCIVYFTIKIFVHEYDDMVRNAVTLKCMFAFEAVIISAVLISLYLVFVRKIKCKKIWNGSLLKWIICKLKEGCLDVVDNGQLLFRTWLPYLIFLCVNLILVLLGSVFILIAFAMDMVIGVWLYNQAKQRNKIADGITTIAGGNTNYKVNVSNMHGDNLALANAVNNIGDGISKAVETSMKDEKMKADLITNVSHDIKTPLTSIINYVDLLKRENITDAKIRSYIAVLDQKSQRLKALINDLVEASKISSGNISLNIEKINLVELINQSVGEFSEKFDEKGLRIVVSKPEEAVHIMADSRGVYRVVENLYNNICKYSLENTRVYIDIAAHDGKASLEVKNISADALNISADELAERFIRGDASRKTEGSGLGLSIAKSLVEAMNGSFTISLDGDLFKVQIGFEQC